jgi:hypothetical protein
MTLIIEDGTGVAGAISYATVAEARLYASIRGLTLPVADAAVETALVKACDYLQSLEDQFKGTRTTPATQPLAWPRTRVFLFGQTLSLDDATIPQQLKSAQCQLAYDAVSTDLLPQGTGREILSEGIGPLSTTYAKRGSDTVRPTLNKAMAILQPLLKTGFGPLSTLRV